MGRLDIASTFEGAVEVEVLTAASGPARDRAPVPDGLSAGVFRNLPAFPPPVAQLLTGIRLPGRIPRALRTFLLILSAKPRGPRILRASKRPISVMRPPSKLLEAVVLNRPLVYRGGR